MILWLLTIGLISLLGQVVLLRELNVAFFGSELIYVLALGFWLLWTAAGAALGRRRYLPSALQVRVLLVVFGGVLPVVVLLVRGLRVLLGGVPGAYLPFPQQLAAMALSLLPVGVLLGLLFQWAAKLYVGRRRTLAAAYAIESAGGVIGGVLATLFLRWGVQNLTAALLCALLALAAACHLRERGRRRWLAAAAGTIGLVLIALGWSADLDRRSSAWNHPQLLATRDSPYSRVTITETAGQLAVFENDVLAFESEGTGAEEFVHLAALQHPAPGSVLVLGGGVEGLVKEVLLHRPGSVDYVELNEVLVDLLTPHLPEDVRRSLDDESVRITIADPRRFLAGERSWDLILVGMPEPDSGRTNRFYTREFFAQCAERLSAGGIVAFRLRGAENLWTPQQTRRAASIHHALREAFPEVVVLPGVTNIFLASKAPLSRDPEILAERLRARQIEARLVIPAYVHYLYTNDRFFEIADLLADAEAPVNSDLRPICYQLTLLIWLSKFFPVMALFEVPELAVAGVVGSPWGWLVMAGVVVVLLLCRRRPVGRRALLAAAAGFAGMVLEIVLILNYQVNRGVLYQDLGLLLTLFMAGLALGSTAIDRLAQRLTRATGAVLLGAFAGLNLLVGWLLPAGAVTGMAGTAALLLACGFLVAAVFAYVSLHRRPDQRAVISALYASDLVGGCLGSLAASLLLIPVVGLAGSSVLMVLLLIATALLI
ncbi:MAG: hypothetical protein GY856_03055 [bacterium]|nr:hypothetical protein [bacterium]